MGSSGLPQRTEARRRRVDLKKKKRKQNFIFVFLSCCQTNFHHQCFSTPHYSLSSLSLSLFWLVVQICSDDQYLTLYIDKISSFSFSLCQSTEQNKLAIPLVAMRW